VENMKEIVAMADVDTRRVAVRSIAWLGGDRLVRDQATLWRHALNQFLPPAADQLARDEFPFLILRVGCFSDNAIDVVSNMLSGDRTPAIDTFIQQVDVNGCSRHQKRRIAV
jgi:hypothetical protein